MQGMSSDVFYHVFIIELHSMTIIYMQKSTYARIIIINFRNMHLILLLIFRIVSVWNTWKVSQFSLRSECSDLCFSVTLRISERFHSSQQQLVIAF